MINKRNSYVPPVFLRILHPSTISQIPAMFGTQSIKFICIITSLILFTCVSHQSGANFRTYMLKRTACGRARWAQKETLPCPPNEKTSFCNNTGSDVVGYGFTSITQFGTSFATNNREHLPVKEVTRDVQQP